VIDKDKYPYTLTTDWGYGTRSQRITDLIQSKIDGGGKISTDDMRQMQLDDSSEIAKLIVPKLLKIDEPDPDVREAQKLLEGWDYTQDADLAAAAYFNSVWRNILKLAFGNKLPKELRVKGQCLYVAPADTTGPADEDEQKVRECGERDADQAQPDGGDRWFEVVRKLMDDPPTTGGRPPSPAPARGGQHEPAVQARHDRRPLGADREARQGHRHWSWAGCTACS